MIQFDPYQYSFPSRRRDVYAANAMVASSHPLATAAGIRMLEKGGNAIDACVAVAIALPVVEPAATSYGSDNFALVWSGGRLHGMSSSGCSPWGLTEEYLRSRPYWGKTDRIPCAGWDSTTLPGCVAGWIRLLKEFGTMSLSEVAQPALELAVNGCPVTPYVQGSFRRWHDLLAEGLGKRELQNFENEFFPGGTEPGPGQIVRHPAMAAFLREMIDTDGASLYEGGKVAQAILRESAKGGGRWTERDFCGFSPVMHDPLGVNYHGYEICELPPNGQGITALMALNILDGCSFRPEDFGHPETVHLQMEAIKLAFADSLRYIGDPDYMTEVSCEMLLDRAYAAERRSLIRPDRAQAFRSGRPASCDTCYFCAADTKGNMISMIQSCYNPFGSAVTIPEYGLVLQSRGATFCLEQGHVNQAGPHKRPYQTIIPGFLMKDGMPLGPFGVMGGFMQPQGHLQVVMNMVDFQMSPQNALDAPRFCWDEGLHFNMEAHYPEGLVEALREKGHRITVQDAFSGSYDDRPFGRGQIILFADESRQVLVGGTDPRGDGSILGI